MTLEENSIVVKQAPFFCVFCGALAILFVKGQGVCKKCAEEVRPLQPERKPIKLNKHRQEP